METSQEIEELTRDLYAAMARSDADYFDRRVAGGTHALAIGTDPQEWWSGQDTVLHAFRAQLEATGGFPIQGGDVVGFERGDVGWAADRFRMSLPDGSEKKGRLTAVYELDGSDWKLVRVHVSFGIPNEELFGELPI